MRIGIDCRMFSINFGIGRYTYELVRHFIKLNSQKAEPDELILFFNNPEYHNFKTDDKYVEKVLVSCPHYSVEEQWELPKILNSKNLDFMHFPHFNVPILYRRPYTVTIHDLTLDHYPGKKFHKIHHRLAYALTIRNTLYSSKGIFSVSKNTKKDILNKYRVKPKKIVVTHLGVNPDFHVLRDQADIKKTLSKYDIKKPFILYTGVWRCHKNLPRLVKAFAKLKEKGFPHMLVFTGKEDPNYPEVRRAIKELKLTDAVITPGLVFEEELVHLYNAADLYVFPSLYEGFGLPPLESMACGTPVVASRVSSIPEVCGEKNALFFNPKDPDQLLSQMEKVLKDKPLRERLVKRGLEHAKHFKWETMAEKTYHSIMETAEKYRK